MTIFKRALMVLVAAFFIAGVSRLGASTAYPRSIVPVEGTPSALSMRSVRPFGRVVRTALTADELAATMHFDVALALQNKATLDSRINRGDILSAAELEAYLPTPADYARVRAWLVAQGFKIYLDAVTRHAIFAEAPSARVAAVFGVTLARVATPDGEFTSAITPPSLPDDLAGVVAGIRGLQPHLIRHPRTPKKPQQLETNSYYAITPAAVAAAYQVPGNLAGNGQTIAVIGSSHLVNSDLTTFWTECGIAQSLNNIVTVDVGSGPGSHTEDQGELSMDVEWTSGLAPNSQVRLYATPYPLDNDSEAAAYTRILNDLGSHPTIHQVTESYGGSESPFEVNDGDTALPLLAAQGVSCFAAAGDGGSNPDTDPTKNSYNSSAPLAVCYPATDPYMTAVGGTTLLFPESLDGAAQFPETAWSVNGTGSGGTGGGISAYISRPSWQVATGVPSGNLRCIPDVSALADTGEGDSDMVAIFFQGGTAYGGEGTSLSSPIWAGLCALINQARATASQGPVGFLNPKLYPAAGSNCFTDITAGSNGAYSTGAGYDLCTGLGTPLMGNLIAYLTATPAAPAITAQPSAQVVSAGDPATFTVAASGVPSPAFQWQREPAGTGSWGNVANGADYSGSVTNALTVTSATVAMNGDQFRCVATNGSGSATSNSASLTVNPRGNAISYDSTTFPSVAVIGATVNFTCSVTNQGTKTWGGNHYLVLRDANGNNLNFASLNGIAPGGSTTAALVLTAPLSPGNYVYRIQAEENNVEWFPTSATLNLTVQPASVSFTTRPLSRVVTAGQSVTFTAAATGVGPVTYAWKHNRKLIAGQNQSSLTIPVAMRADSGYYEVIASDSEGSAESVVYLAVAPINGVVTAWGDNYYGQLNVPTGLANVLGVAAGLSVSLAIQSGGTVAQWGYLLSSSDVPPQNLSGVVAVDAGSYHALALKSDGTVVAWGYADWGATSVPAGLTNVVAIAAGDTLSLALKADGTVVEWGTVGTSGSNPVPSGLTNVVAIAAGRFDCLALQADGTIVTWGDIRTVPTSVTDVTAIAAGWYDTVAIEANGTVVQWGDLDISPPTGLNGAIAVTTTYVDSNGYSLALLGDGSLVTWGYIGPTLPAGLGNVYSIASGASHSLALSSTTNLEPSIAVQPISHAVSHSGSTTFTVQVAGTPAPSFQWQRQAAGTTTWLSLDDSSDYSGTATATLTVLNAALAQNGDAFRCIVTNAAGTVTSVAATLTVQVDSGDLNGDGHPDILWTNTSTGDRAIWYLDGTSIGSFGYLAGIPTEWKIVGTADFDGDGQTDILWEDTTTGDRSIWLMSGTTILNFAYLAYVDPVWHIAAVGDFNGDGKADVIWENTSTGDRAIWFLNGTGIDSFGYIAGISTDWHIVGAADIDGDGQTDLIWENLVTGDRTVWFMNGATLSSFGYIANIPGAWHIAMVADFDGDGHPDLLWENTTTGDRAIWLMNGTTQLSAPYLAYVDPVWRIAP